MKGGGWILSISEIFLFQIPSPWAFHNIASPSIKHHEIRKIITILQEHSDVKSSRIYQTDLFNIPNLEFQVTRPSHFTHISPLSSYLPSNTIKRCTPGSFPLHLPSSSNLSSLPEPQLCIAHHTSISIAPNPEKCPRPYSHRITILRKVSRA